MKIGIVGAMAQEVEILSGLMTDKTETRVASAVILEGKINGKAVALLQSGIGKVAAAIGTAALLQLTKPDAVLNTGSAGGVARGLKVGDIVISDETRYHDVDVTAFGYEKGQLPANPAAFLSDKKLADLAEKVAQESKGEPGITLSETKSERVPICQEKESYHETRNHESPQLLHVLPQKRKCRGGLR